MNGNAKAVEEDTQNQNEADPAPPTIDLSNVDPKAIKMAEKFGIPVGGIIQWAQYQEARMNRIEEYLQKTLPEEMKKAFQEGLNSTIQNMQKTQGTPAPEGQQGFGLGDLMRMAPALLGSSSGGSDEEMNRLVKDMLRTNLDRMKADISFSESIKNAVVSKIAGKAIEGL